MNKKSEKEAKDDRFDIKFDYLENRINDVHSFLKYTISGITIILTIAAIILSYLSFTSKKDVENAIRDMEKKFELLSDKALQNPYIEIFHSQMNLDGQLLSLKLSNNTHFEFSGVYLKNLGDGISKFMSIKLFLSEDIDQSDNEWWGKYSTSDSSLTTYYLWGGEIPISPGDFWNIKSFKGKIKNKTIKIINCRMEVFYGGIKPAVAHFRIELI